ncbi:MAG: M20/M25/M40 family metallo-hydrolase [Thermoleophilaceae bacterium]
MRRALTTIVACLAASLVLAPAASAIDKVDTKKLRKGVTLDGILEHERAFQNIAIAHDDNRAATTSGYDASVEYVSNRLKAAGYRVSLDEFDFPVWAQNGPSTLAEISPTARTFAEGTDYIVSQFSAAGDLTANVVPTNDIVFPAPGGPGTSTSGCEPSDFPAATAGNIALMQRGTCPFVQKYQNAKNAGAVAALIFNDGFEGRTAPLFITSPVNIGIPTIMTSSDVGRSLYTEAQSGPVSLNVVVDATTTPNTEVNVIADSPRGQGGRTIVVGAHLDGVAAGPGINDNGSGSAGILEIAEQVAQLDERPRNRLRFAFWGAEEAGLVGSTAYVNEQAQTGGIKDIEANLNFDMIGSPNFVRFVYDGDLSDSTPPPSGAPPGSAQIEQMFLRYFDRQGLATDPTAFDGRSDYGPFISNKVPAGGLFTGAEGLKTQRQADIYGGFVGMQYDPNYHEEGDTFFNLSHTALDQMSDAAAHAAWTLARSRSSIIEATAAKAKKGKRAKRGKAWKFQGPFRVR